MDLIEIYSLIEELQQFFHQPLNFENTSEIKLSALQFAETIYPKLHKAYYETMPKLLKENNISIEEE